jgi:hypothetical protein
MIYIPEKHVKICVKKDLSQNAERLLIVYMKACGKQTKCTVSRQVLGEELGLFVQKNGKCTALKHAKRELIEKDLIVALDSLDRNTNSVSLLPYYNLCFRKGPLDSILL